VPRGAPTLAGLPWGAMNVESGKGPGSRYTIQPSLDTPQVSAKKGASGRKYLNHQGGVGCVACWSTRCRRTRGGRVLPVYRCGGVYRSTWQEKYRAVSSLLCACDHWDGCAACLGLSARLPRAGGRAGCQKRDTPPRPVRLHLVLPLATHHPTPP
jgi:hypothetical protein